MQQTLHIPGPRIAKRLLVAAAVLAIAGACAGTGRAANMGFRPATANDTWIQCGYGEVDFMAPGYASTARRAVFTYTLNGGGFQNSRWFYFSGSRDYYFENGTWLPFSPYASLENLAGGTVVHAWEYRLLDNGSAYYVDLGSCTVEVNPMANGGYTWDYEPLG
jgi:hypothetical protein